MKHTGRKIILLLIMQACMVTTVKAQDDIRALGAAVDTIVRVFTQDYIVTKIVNDVFEKNNRNAALGTRIAQAYYHYNETTEENRYNAQATHKYRNFHKNDTVTALKYIRAALQTDSSYAKAYVLAADMFDYDGQSDVAMDWLERGLKNNRSDSTLYIAEAEILARTDIEKAKEKLAELKALDPNFLMDRYVARIYKKIDVRGVDYLREIAENYSKMDLKAMTQEEMETMIYSFNYSGQLDECVNKGEQCLKYYPKSLAINRFYFRALAQKKMFKEAVESFDKLLQAEIPKEGVALLELEDSLFLGRSLAGTKKYEKAMTLYDEILAKPGLDERQKKNVDLFISELMSARLKEYTDLGDYQKAVDMYKAYVDKRRSEGTLTDDVISNYAKIYRDWSTELNGAEKATTLMKADPIYAEGQEMSKENKDLFLYNRFFIRFSLDPEIKGDEPLPFAKQMIDMLLAIPSRDRGQTARLLMGYEYLMRFEYFHNKNKKAAIAVAEKMLDIDPSHQTALQFIAVLSK